MKKRSSRTQKNNKVLTLLTFIFGSIAVGSIGSLATAPAITTWYAGLIKPSFSPPNWIFGPVWTTLFALMGISAYLVWEVGWKKKDVRLALSMFIVQFVFNVVWSFAFFALHSPILGLLDIIMLWIAIIITIMLFSKVKREAAVLLLPYIAWVSFAMVLNAAVYQLNG